MITTGIIIIMTAILYFVYWKNMKLKRESYQYADDIISYFEGYPEEHPYFDNKQFSHYFRSNAGIWYIYAHPNLVMYSLIAATTNTYSYIISIILAIVSFWLVSPFLSLIPLSLLPFLWKGSLNSFFPGRRNEEDTLEQTFFNYQNDYPKDPFWDKTIGSFYSLGSEDWMHWALSHVREYENDLRQEDQ